MGGYTILLLDPYATDQTSAAELTLHLSTVHDEQQSRDAKTWVEWSGVRDPLTGTYHSGSVPERLFCPDGIYPILGGLPDSETTRWLRRGFGAKYRPEEAPAQPDFQL